MSDENDVRTRALKVAEEQKDQGINFDEFNEDDPDHLLFDSSDDITPEVKEAMEGVGVEVTDRSSGTDIQGNNAPTLCVSHLQRGRTHADYGSIEKI